MKQIYLISFSVYIQVNLYIKKYLKIFDSQS
jgi:hypothetical protein